jgi:hypothetical protein
LFRRNSGWQGRGEVAEPDRLTLFLELLQETAGALVTAFSNRSKFHVNFVSRRARLPASGREKTLPAWRRKPAGEPGGQAAQNGKITDRVWIT